MGNESEYGSMQENLERARETIKEQDEVLRNIKESPLLLFTIEKISEDGKWTYYKSGDKEMRVKATPDLKVGHEVLLHPQSFQVVENLGFPPVEASRFAPSDVPNVCWEDIGGLEQAKQDIREAIELPFKEKKLYKFYNKRPVKGILLSGQPGCGKTMLGKAAANSLSNMHGAKKARTGFLYVKGAEVLNAYVGESERTVRKIFSDARLHYKEFKYPAIVFIDEADAILATRGQRGGSTLGSTLVPTFLTEMDGLEDSTVIVILATNRPDILDPAVVREGRIDRKIEVTRPSRENALQIVINNLRQFPVSKEYELNNLAEGLVHEIFSEERYVSGDALLSDVVNGAMLAACVDLAVANAIHREIGKGKPKGITAKDVLGAVERIHHQNREKVYNIKKAA